jgi:hypothetical protein
VARDAEVIGPRGPTDAPSSPELDAFGARAVDGSDAPVDGQGRGCPPDEVVPRVRWVTTWGGADVDRGKVVFARGTELVVGGSFNGTTDLDPRGGDTRTAAKRDLYLSTFRSDGTRLASRTMGGPLLADGLELAGAAQALSGATYVTTKFRGTLNADPGVSNDQRTSNNYGVALMKFGPSGVYEWMRSWEVATFFVRPRVALGPGEWIFVLGQFDGVVDFDPGPSADVRNSKDGFFFVEKLKADGAHDWVRTFQPGNSNNGGVADLAVALDGSIWVTGFLDEPFVSKFDADGAPLFTLRWSGGNDFPRRIVLGSSGSVYVAGVFSTKDADFDPGPGEDLHSTQGGYDVFLSKFDELGQHEWTRTWGGRMDDEVGDLSVEPCGAIWVLGVVGSRADLDPGFGKDVHDKGNFASKLRSDGSYAWALTWQSDQETSTDPWGIAVEMGGPVWITGSFVGTVDFGAQQGPSIRTSKGREDAFLMRLE